MNGLDRPSMLYTEESFELEIELINSIISSADLYPGYSNA
jgi:hypothetical protein